MNFFDSVRNLKTVQENANCDYSMPTKEQETTQHHGNLLVEKDPAEALAARRHSQEANALSQTAHYHGGDHAQASAVHTYAFLAHNKLAKQADPHAAAYHRELADSHYRMSKLHDAASKKQ